MYGYFVLKHDDLHVYRRARFYIDLTYNSYHKHNFRKFLWTFPSIWIEKIRYIEPILLHLYGVQNTNKKIVRKWIHTETHTNRWLCTQCWFVLYQVSLNAWWRLYASANWISLGSGNGLSPVRRHAWMFTNADALSTRPKGTYINGIIFEVIELKRFCKEMYLKIPSHRWCQFCLGLDVLMPIPYIILILILIKALMTTIFCRKINSGILEFISKRKFEVNIVPVNCLYFHDYYCMYTSNPLFSMPRRLTAWN